MSGRVEWLQQALLAVAGVLGPHLTGSTVKRSVVESALGARPSAHLRSAVEQLLADARITIDEDVAAVTTVPDPADMPSPAPAPRQVDPRAAARRRLDLDRARPAGRLHRVLLTAEEEVGLTLLARHDGAPLPAGGYALLEGEAREAADALILHNLRLAHSVARSHQGQGLEHEDLYQNALCGLVRAVERFDPAAGFKFSTYAMWWLRQAVTRAIANESRLVRLPVHMWERIRKVRAVRERLTVDGRPPRAADLALACQLTEEQVKECLRLAPPSISLDTPLGDDGLTLGDLTDAQADQPEQVQVRGLFPEDLAPLFLRLSEKEADVLRRRHGLSPYDEKHTLDEIGMVHGVTRERIRQIESKALSKLRVAVGIEKPKQRKRRRALELPVSA